MKVTAKLLRSKRACDAQVRRFTRLFPKGAVVNRKNLLRARRLPLKWFLINLYPAKIAELGRKEKSILAAWHTANVLIWNEFEKNVAADKQRYNKDLASISKLKSSDWEGYLTKKDRLTTAYIKRTSPYVISRTKKSVQQDKVFNKQLTMLVIDTLAPETKKRGAKSASKHN